MDKGFFDAGCDPATMDKESCGSGGKNSAKWDDDLFN